MSFATINPATGVLVTEYPEMSNAEVVDIINATQLSFFDWQQYSYSERADLMRKTAEILLARKHELAALMTQEMGKTLKSGVGEIEKCAWVCNYYADNTEEFLKPEIIKTEARISKVVFRPIGIVLAVMPWNFPYWQVFRFAAPALMAGNAGLLKHAPNVCGSSLAIEQIFREAGFPRDLFRSLLIDIEETSRVIEDSRVKAVTLTGSTRAGRAVGAKAGDMLKKSVLELGGSDPYIVLDDADMELCINACVTSRLLNAGQSCIAAKRFIVVESRMEEFTEKFVARMAAVKTGDPTDPATDLGPQARFDLREDLHRQVRKSVDKGAKLLLGGVIPPGEGAYYYPTVLADVKPGMPAYNEELFGPVAAIITATDTEDAIRIANDTRFGLGAAVFTQDLELGEDIATNRIRSGACFVNDFVKSDPRLPFGGLGASGYGRELSDYGMKEFVNIKTVCVA
jgi:succinate-semialdehyde dehydrogenase/glutarate-semialdehyde dehydrogenase